MAVARESLSPLFNSPHTRRLSLELCQKLGFNNIFPSLTSPVKSQCENLNINKNELRTPSPNKAFSYWPQNPNISSPNFRNSPNQKSPLRNCRRGSDSFRWNCSPFSNLQNETTQTPIRRGSLTLSQFKDAHKTTTTPTQSNEDVYDHNQYPWSPRRNSISVLLQDDILDSKNTLYDSDSENRNFKVAKNYSSERVSSSTIEHSAPLADTADGRVNDGNGEWWQLETQSIINRNNKPKNKKKRRKKLIAKEVSVTCNIIPPSPKTTFKAALNENENIFPEDFPIDIFSEEVPLTFNTNVSKSQTQSPLKEDQIRRSSSNRYDFGNEFMHFVSTKCNLELNPDDVLGRGSFGTVITANYHGKPVAVKLINTKSTKHSESMKSEENAMNLPSHPNVAKVIDIFQLGPDRALIVMERLRKGNLLSMLNDPRVSIPMPLKIKICIDIGSALVFCHVHGILHLDVKPQNVLIDIQDRCKLSDFGNSKLVSELPFLTDFNKLDGTVTYKAPELFRGICPSEKCDVYSFGISMWQILTREAPYKAEADHSIIYKVVSQGLRPRSKFNVVSPQIKSYVQIYEDCWCQEPTFRPSMNAILQKLQQLKLI